MRVVTREELQAKIWKGDKFVDSANGLNAAVKKLRQTLGDSAESPRYLGMARAYVVDGNREQALESYREFFALSKDADADVPILRQARAEYGRLNASVFESISSGLDIQ